MPILARDQRPSGPSMVFQASFGHSWGGGRVLTGTGGAWVQACRAAPTRPQHAALADGPFFELSFWARGVFRGFSTGASSWASVVWRATAEGVSSAGGGATARSMSGGGLPGATSRPPTPPHLPLSVAHPTH